MIIILWWAILLSTYIFYPLLMRFLAKGKSLNRYNFFEKNEDLPAISIIMAAHNEESVLENKLNSIFSSDYELSKVKVYIGLDNCSDRSREITESYQKKYPDNIFFLSSERIGKPQMLNKIFSEFKPSGEVSIFTDANVLFTKETIYELAKYFKTEEVGLVDTRYALSEDLITHQHEISYLGFEQQLKYNEGVVWGAMQGPFGGCFAIRTHLFYPIPQNFLVDDFFLGMAVMIKGFYSILNPQALAVEEVHTDWQDEYNRKRRIAAGNFQNLFYFSSVFRKPFTSLSFSWFFHKILRWLAPLLFIDAVLLSFVEIYCFKGSALPLIVTLILIIGAPLSHYLLQRLNLHLRTIERLSYFIYINLALVQGFFDYLKGVKSNVWKPTQRK